MKRPLVVALALVVAAGWLLRAWPALSFGDWWRVPVDYDDAVYFSSSALLWRGELPYRDFVLVHPPGLLLFLAPISSLVGAVGAAQAFSLARWLMTLVGAASIALSARAAHRAAGPVAAVAAAVAYAVDPSVVAAERSTYLEPVLNLACLLLANLWLSQRVERRPRWARAAGLALGFAVTVKLWALIWAVACLVSTPSRRAIAGLAAAATVAVIVVTGPFLAAAPADLVEQVIEFQIWRPPDGLPSGVERLIAIFSPSWPIAVLAVIGLSAAALRRVEQEWRSARFFGAAWLLIVVAFLTAKTYWPTYDSHLAPAQAHLAGLGVAFLWSFATRAPVLRPRLARGALVALVLAAAWPPLHRCVVESRIGGDLMERIAARVRAAVPDDACYFPFEPAWALAADRLPSASSGRPVVADVYATMLLWGRRSGRQHDSAGAEMLGRASQEGARELLSGCEFLSLGERGRLQLTPRTRDWIERRWEELPATDGIEAGVDLWRLRAVPASGAPDRESP